MLKKQIGDCVANVFDIHRVLIHETIENRFFHYTKMKELETFLVVYYRCVRITGYVRTVKYPHFLYCKCIRT